MLEHELFSSRSLAIESCFCELVYMPLSLGMKVSYEIYFDKNFSRERFIDVSKVIYPSAFFDNEVKCG